MKNITWDIITHSIKIIMVNKIEQKQKVIMTKVNKTLFGKKNIKNITKNTMGKYLPRRG